MSGSLQRLLEILPEAMLLVKDGKVVCANRAAHQDLGLPVGEVVGRPLADFVGDPAALHRYVELCSRNRSMSLGAMTIRGSKGSIACRAEGAAIPGEDGGIVIRLKLRESATQQFVALNRKIDELTAEIGRRIDAEKGLRESEQKFQQLAEAMPQFVWMADAEGRIDYFNRQWHDFTGIDQVDGADESWRLTIHPDDLELCLEAWHEAVRTGQPFEMEYRFRDQSTNGYKWFLGRALPVRNSEGEIVRWFGTSTAIDEYKRALEAVEGLNRRKDEFLAMLAHELRNPLAPIRNATQIFRAFPEIQPELQRASAMIERQVDHMTRLVDDLLDVARITSGKIRLNKSKVAIDVPLRQAIDTVQQLLNERAHRLIANLPSLPIYVEGDSVRLTQVFGNILQNAAKYSNGPGTIEVSLRQAEQEAVITVTDSGIGIDESLLPHIFEIFTQGDRSLDRSQGGLGIGLTLVKSLVDLHGGKVTARSSGADCGSCFEVRLPALATPEPEARPVLTAPQSADGTMRVLVVDDNVDSADSIAMLLEIWGYQTSVAYEGASALERAEIEQPRAVLLDIGLPTMSGYEVAARLRESCHAATLIAVTGYGQTLSMEKARKAGFHHYLVKPVNTDKLREILAEL